MNSKNSGQDQSIKKQSNSREQESTEHAYGYYQNLIVKSNPSNNLQHSGSLIRVQTHPKKLPVVSQSTSNVFLRKTQSKLDLIVKKEPVSDPLTEAESKSTHFPRPSAEFRYKQDYSDTVRSSLEAEVVINGIIVEGQHQSQKKTRKNVPEVLRRDQTRAQNSSENLRLNQINLKHPEETIHEKGL